jgi:hypothetical protein
VLPGVPSGADLRSVAHQLHDHPDDYAWVRAVYYNCDLFVISFGPDEITIVASCPPRSRADRRK